MQPSRRPPLSQLALLAIGAALLVACSAVGASPSPAPTSISRQAAVAAVLTTDPRFAGARELDPQAVGLSRWYEVALDPAGGWRIDVTLGSGDCPAGCIERDVYHFHVSPVGLVEPLGHEHNPTPAPLPSTGPHGGLAGHVLLGPTCPVEREPPDPACAPRPVAGALIVATDAAGHEAARTTSRADGTYALPLPAGSYTIAAQPVPGAMRAPAPQPIVIPPGPDGPTLDLLYDSGIR